MGRSVEHPELYRALLPYRMQVERVISALVIVSAAPVRLTIIPYFHYVVFAVYRPCVYPVYESAVHFLAVVFPSAVHSQRLEQQVFLTRHYVGDVFYATGSMRSGIYVHVDFMQSFT
jgi:hypothetical protein